MAIEDKAIVEIKGFNVLHDKITKLTDSVKKKELLKILRIASEATVKAARLAAPKSKKTHIISGKRKRRVVQPGNLKKSIGKIVGKRGFARENAVLYVGPRAKGRKHDGFYGGFVHGGHTIVDRQTTRTQRTHGKRRDTGIKTNVPANPFMDRAFKITQGKVTGDAERRVAKLIDKQILKLSEKGL